MRKRRLYLWLIAALVVTGVLVWILSLLKGGRLGRVLHANETSTCPQGQVMKQDGPRNKFRSLETPLPSVMESGETPQGSAKALFGLRGQSCPRPYARHEQS